MDHILTAVDADLGSLTHAVAAMGDLAVAQVRAAVDVFVRHDLLSAEKVVRADNAVDLQDIEIEKKRVPRLENAPSEAQSGSVAELGRMASERLAAVINAYRNDDAQGAYNVWLKDTDIDERHEGVVREIVANMAAAPDSVGDSIHLLFIAKNLERIGDHATNVAELVHYQITGTDLSNRPKL